MDPINRKLKLRKKVNNYYYGARDYPSYNDFGEPHLKDSNNRLYKLAKTTDSYYNELSYSIPEYITDKGGLKLFIKLPKDKNIQWVKPNDKETFYFITDEYNTKPFNLTIDQCFHYGKTSRTGYVFVYGEQKYLKRIIKKFLYFVNSSTIK